MSWPFMRVTTLEMKPTTAVGKLKEEEACAGIEVVILKTLANPFTHKKASMGSPMMARRDVFEKNHAPQNTEKTPDK